MNMIIKKRRGGIKSGGDSPLKFRARGEPPEMQKSRDRTPLLLLKYCRIVCRNDPDGRGMRLSVTSERAKDQCAVIHHANSMLTKNRHEPLGTKSWGDTQDVNKLIFRKRGDCIDPDGRDMPYWQINRIIGDFVFLNWSNVSYSQIISLITVFIARGGRGIPCSALCKSTIDK